MPDTLGSLVCTKCGKEQPLSRFRKRKDGAKGFHSACKTCIAMYKKSYYHSSDERKAACQKAANDNHKRLKLAVIAEYGGRCVCCGESEPMFLTIDHIYGGGASHRREIGGGSNTLYKFLKRNNYPKDDFQLLCFNCNCAKGFYGVCPHINKNN